MLAVGLILGSQNCKKAPLASLCRACCGPSISTEMHRCHCRLRQTCAQQKPNNRWVWKSCLEASFHVLTQTQSCPITTGCSYRELWWSDAQLRDVCRYGHCNLINIKKVRVQLGSPASGWFISWFVWVGYPPAYSPWPRMKNPGEVSNNTQYCTPQCWFPQKQIRHLSTIYGSKYFFSVCMALLTLYHTISQHNEMRRWCFCEKILI